MTKRIIAFLIGAALILGIVFYWPVDVLTIRLPRRENQVVRAAKVRPGEGVILTYRHSVEGGEVQGIFVVEPGPRLILTETRMDSVGTGLPNTGYESSRQNGKWRVKDEGRRAFWGMRFFYSPLNRTRLEAAGKEIILHDLPAGSLLLISTEKVCLGRLIMWRATGRSWPIKGEGS